MLSYQFKKLCNCNIFTFSPSLSLIINWLRANGTKRFLRANWRLVCWNDEAISNVEQLTDDFRLGIFFTRLPGGTDPVGSALWNYWGAFEPTLDDCLRRYEMFQDDLRGWDLEEALSGTLLDGVNGIIGDEAFRLEGHVRTSDLIYYTNRTFRTSCRLFALFRLFWSGNATSLMMSGGHRWRQGPRKAAGLFWSILITITNIVSCWVVAIQGRR